MEIIDTVVSPKGRRHDWLWLTKRPKRMAKFSAWLDAQGVPWPNNLWAGTTVTSVSTTSRIADLLKVGTSETIRFLSVEPQLERLDLRRWLRRLNLVIQAGESGKEPRPFDIAWALDMQRSCQETGVAYFLKQLGACPFRGKDRVHLRDSHGGDWSEWPDDVPRVRQMPHGGVKSAATNHKRGLTPIASG
jgi:protein gp37